MTVSMKRPEFRTGPDGTDYDMHKSTEFRAWELAWEEYLGVAAGSALTVEREHRGGGRPSVVHMPEQDEIANWLAEIDDDIASAEAYDVADDISAAAYAAFVASRQPVAPAEPVTEGMYLLPNGTVAKVQVAVNGSGNLYAKRLDPETGSFEYAPGLIRQLRAEFKMTLEQAKEFGHLYGRCCVCGRTLTDETSIAEGIGPICSGRLAGEAGA